MSTTRTSAERIIHYTGALAGSSLAEVNYILRTNEYPDLCESSWEMITRSYVVAVLRHDPMNVLRFSVKHASMAEIGRMADELGLRAPKGVTPESGVFPTDEAADTQRSAHAAAE